MPPRRNRATRPNTLEIKNPEDDAYLEPVDIPVYEAPPPQRDQTMDAISQLVSALDRDRMARHPAAESGYSLKDFYHHKPDSFDGTGDHISADNWLNDMEELLNLTSCTKRQKVMYTTYKLSGEAKRWWGAQRNLLVMELGAKSAITWTRFKKEFDNRYFLELYEKLRLKSSWTLFKEA
jgi:hypothetical protein